MKKVFTLFLLCFLAGCALPQAATPPVVESPQVTAGVTATMLKPLESTPDPFLGTVLPSETVEAPAGPTLTATPDPRLPPEQWREYPVIPERVSARAIEIYQRGLANGTDPHAFSVVGDCQAIKDVLFGEFDDPRKYHLETRYQYLQETIDYFQGSFNRDGMGVRGGFTAATILSPLHADPEYCKPGETPLTCEFRVHNPSILVISLEVWRDPTTVDHYPGYLRQIIEASLERGVLPILATKADMAEAKQHVINPAVAQLAYEYDLPLWNFWRAAQPLADHGIDPERDGFHLSKEAWTVKSFTALQALDAVWRGVRGETIPLADAGLTPTPAVPEPSPTATLPLLAPPTVCQAVAGKTPACAIFGLAESQDGVVVNKGVYLFDLEGQRMGQVAPEGFDLQAVSPDRSMLLLNRADQLYLARLDGSPLLYISDGFVSSGKNNAIWMAGGQRLALIARREGSEAAAWLYDIANGAWQRLTSAGETPISLNPASDPARVYWDKGVCDSGGACTAESAWFTGVDGSAPQQMNGMINPAFSPDGLSFAFMDPEYKKGLEGEFNDMVLLEQLAQPLVSRRSIHFPPANGFKVRNRVEGYLWAPDSSRLLVLIDEHSNYYERSAGYHIFAFNINGGLMLEFERLVGVMPHAAWLADSERVLLQVTETLPSGEYRQTFRIQDVVRNESRLLDQNAALTSANYSYLTRLYMLTP